MLISVDIMCYWFQLVLLLFAIHVDSCRYYLLSVPIRVEIFWYQCQLVPLLFAISAD